MTWKQELAAIERFALEQARIGKEKSRALEQHKYRDPARYVEFAAEIARQAVKKSKQRKGK